MNFHRKAKVVWKVALVGIPFAIAMSVANISGNLLGSHLAMKNGDNLVQRIVIVSLTILFVYLLVKCFISGSS